MSGRKQHYIPRFLQKGFASRNSGSEYYAYVYKKDGDGPYESNTKGIGAQRDFYCADETLDADGKITEMEVAFSNLVERLRTGPLGRIVNPNISEMFHHFATRTANMRHELNNTIGGMIGILPEALEANLSGVDWERSRLLEKAIEQYGPLSDLEKKMVHGAIRDGSFERMLINSIPSVARQLNRCVDEAGRNGQINALAKGSLPFNRSDEWEAMEYEVYETNYHPLILGDSIVFYESRDTPKYFPLLNANHDRVAAYLPISSKRAIVASRSLPLELPSDLNEGAAMSSYDYFMASERTESNQRLAEMIGQQAFMFSDEDLKSMCNDEFREFIVSEL